MKAVRLHTYGGPLPFEELSSPVITDNEVLVKIRSTAINHLDLVEASGTAIEAFPIVLPWTPGHEFSGVVERVGKDARGFAPGDPVFGNSTSGAFAEYVAVKPAAIVAKLLNLSFDEAASVPVAAQTAWQGIFTHGHLRSGQTILIHGSAIHEKQVRPNKRQRIRDDAARGCAPAACLTADEFVSEKRGLSCHCFVRWAL